MEPFQFQTESKINRICKGRQRGGGDSHLSIQSISQGNCKRERCCKSNSKSGTDYTGSAFNQLFVSQRNGESAYLAKPSFLRSDMQNNYNEGPVSYSADGKKVVFCRNNFMFKGFVDVGLYWSCFLISLLLFFHISIYRTIIE